jgi:hypothetical protein
MVAGSRQDNVTLASPVAVLDSDVGAMGVLLYRWNGNASSWNGFPRSYDGVALIVERGLGNGTAGYRLMAMDFKTPLTGVRGNKTASNYRRLVHGWELPISPRDPPGSPGWGKYSDNLSKHVSFLLLPRWYLILEYKGYLMSQHMRLECANQPIDRCRNL